MKKNRGILIFCFLFVVHHLSFGQSENTVDSVFWNREFKTGTNIFLNPKLLAFHDMPGNYHPGYVAEYSLKRVHSSGHGLIFNFGFNSFGWKGDKEDYYESLSPEQIELSRAVNYSLFRYTYSQVSVGYYIRRYKSKYIFEGNFSIGTQLISYSRYREIRKYQSGGFKFLRDDAKLELNPSPLVSINAKFAKRIGKRHLIFLDVNYKGVLNLDPLQWISFASINAGVSKDFMMKKRKPRNGKKFNDNYIYTEGLGLAQYYSLNYERNLSTLENFRLNLRVGFGYYEVYDQLIGMNLVLGNRVERFEVAVTYNNRRDVNYENPLHIVSPSVSYRAETIKRWLFRLTLGPAVSIQENISDFSVRFGASVGKKFGTK